MRREFCRVLRGQAGYCRRVIGEPVTLCRQADKGAIEIVVVVFIVIDRDGIVTALRHGHAGMHHGGRGQSNTRKLGMWREKAFGDAWIDRDRDVPFAGMNAFHGDRENCLSGACRATRGRCW